MSTLLNIFSFIFLKTCAKKLIIYSKLRTILRKYIYSVLLLLAVWAVHFHV